MLGEDSETNVESKLPFSAAISAYRKARIASGYCVQLRRVRAELELLRRSLEWATTNAQRNEGKPTAYLAT